MHPKRTVKIVNYRNLSRREIFQGLNAPLEPLERTLSSKKKRKLVSEAELEALRQERDTAVNTKLVTENIMANMQDAFWTSLGMYRLQMNSANASISKLEAQIPPSAKLHTCIIHDDEVETGVACSDDETHFVCEKCCALALKSSLQGESIVATVNGSYDIKCMAYVCPGVISGHAVSALSRVCYQTMQKIILNSHEAKVIAPCEKELAVLRAANQSPEQQASRLVADMFTNSCPKGHVFFDFAGCFALKCDVDTGAGVLCNTYFCGFCFVTASSNSALHTHVVLCDRNPSRNLFGRHTDFIQGQIDRGLAKVQEFVAGDITKLLRGLVQKTADVVAEELWTIRETTRAQERARHADLVEEERVMDEDGAADEAQDDAINNTEIQQIIFLGLQDARDHLHTAEEAHQIERAERERDALERADM
jgi:hypothetical protein